MTDPYNPGPQYGPDLNKSHDTGGQPQYGQPAPDPYGPQPGNGQSSHQYSQPQYPQAPYGQPLNPYAQPMGPGFGGPATPNTGVPLVTIGDIAVVDGFVVTPAGSFPVRGATWTATDMSQTSESMPAYAVVLAILFIWMCFLSLLFLLIKQRTVTGYVQVTVTGTDGRFHSTMIPVQDQFTFPAIMHKVNYARSLSAM
ncbi:hypothetical protein [Nocardia sp. NPDC058666]|uniref:hypothetical protein n=1 Tax=Nocardia sp. NPDC058666 TaxID=3346587 RepID=UPI0036534270